jgi:hypothetical protein
MMKVSTERERGDMFIISCFLFGSLKSLAQPKGDKELDRQTDRQRDKETLRRG